MQSTLRLTLPDDFSGSLLDVPVVTGMFTVEKYRDMKHAEITALDYSEVMLAQARRRFKDVGNVTCVQGDAGKLPHADGEFDVVLFMNGFHAFPDKDAAFFRDRSGIENGRDVHRDLLCQGGEGSQRLDGKYRASETRLVHAPVFSKAELMDILRKHYGAVELDNVNSMAILRCVKRR
ncbi:MAG: class I SAM-dependent methyltransferase [Deltaproteobacteria bacterium]|jgi:SAM-dependent methyltransferase|nr:class I SAM-dependent methyltransferase [Deltaproteobacteria bacterium]